MVELWNGLVSGVSGRDRGGGITNIVVILSAQVDSGDVHSTVICPVVCERDDKFNAQLLCNFNNLVECL